MRGEILSGPAAFPGFNLKSCLDTPETDIVMFCMEGELSLEVRVQKDATVSGEQARAKLTRIGDLRC